MTKLSKEFKERRRAFLKDPTSKDSPRPTFDLTDFWSLEEAKRYLELAKKMKSEGKNYFAEPEVENQSLESLFLWRREGSDEVWLDSVDLSPEGSFFTKCGWCRKDFIGKSSKQLYCSRKCAGHGKYRTRERKSLLKRQKEMGKEASKIVLEQERLRLERQFTKKTLKMNEKWRKKEGMLDERIRKLREKVLHLEKEGKELRAKMKEEPVCCACGVELTVLNWYSSQRSRGSKICRLCQIRQSSERYYKRKEMRKIA